MNRHVKRHRRKAGISPVIATVIIVAIAIAIAIAVAFWAVGITASFTRFEKVEITSAYSNEPCLPGPCQVTLTFKNTGSVDVTIDDIFVNGKPSDVMGLTVTSGSTLPIFIKSGELPKTIIIELTDDPADHPYTAGQAVEIALHTASGKTFPASVTLM